MRNRSSNRHSPTDELWNSADYCASDGRRHPLYDTKTRRHPHQGKQVCVEKTFHIVTIGAIPPRARISTRRASSVPAFRRRRKRALIKPHASPFGAQSSLHQLCSFPGWSRVGFTFSCCVHYQARVKFLPTLWIMLFQFDGASGVLAGERCDPKRHCEIFALISGSKCWRHEAELFN
jgi:hypothetical protein